MFGWNDSYSVGQADIDAQHKQLFAVIDELQGAMKTGQSKAILGRTLDKLVDYTVKHFSFEQALLAQKGYRESAAHKSVHDQFTARIRKFQVENNSGALGVSVELMDVLRKWLAEHIQGSDMKYAKELGWKK
jgi:hemerythrin-like metal-binding protein